MRRVFAIWFQSDGSAPAAIGPKFIGRAAHPESGLDRAETIAQRRFGKPFKLPHAPV